MTKRLVGQLHGFPIVTDDEMGDNEFQIVPAYNFSRESVDDLCQMLIDCVRAGFKEDAEFINAVREEIKARKAATSFTEDQLPPYKHRYLYSSNVISFRKKDDDD